MDILKLRYIISKAFQTSKQDRTVALVTSDRKPTEDESTCEVSLFTHV